MGIRVTEAKRGMVIRYQGELYQITKYDHVTPGNWRAIHHLNLRNLKTGRQKDVRMSTSDVIEPQFVEAKDCQYLYQDANGHVFMDNESYEQFHLPQDVIQDALRYIVEGDAVQVVYVESDPLNVQLPAAVVLEVTEAEEAVKGDTVSNLQKSATLATGYTLKVPGHVKAGDKVKVNTETGEFLGRAQRENAKEQERAPTWRLAPSRKTRRLPNTCSSTAAVPSRGPARCTRSTPAAWHR